MSVPPPLMCVVQKEYEIECDSKLLFLYVSFVCIHYCATIPIYLATYMQAHALVYNNDTHQLYMGHKIIGCVLGHMEGKMLKALYCETPHHRSP